MQFNNMEIHSKKKWRDKIKMSNLKADNDDFCSMKVVIYGLLFS